MRRVENHAGFGNRASPDQGAFAAALVVGVILAAIAVAVLVVIGGAS